MPSKKKSTWQSVLDFYHLYTHGLSRQEIEHLLKQESHDVLSFYRRESERNGQTTVERDFPVRQLKFVSELFLSFVLRLTPARRMFYGIACVLFFVAMATANWLYAFVAFVLFNLLLAFELADRMLAKDELEIARDIQVGLQPEQNPVFPGVEIAVFYQPAKEVGGDYYNLLAIDETRFGLMVGDVSGKGLPAALYAVKLQGLFEILIKHQAMPQAMLSRINEIIANRLKKQFFVTAVAAVFDLGTNQILLSRAGHMPPLYVRNQGNESEWLLPDGIGIGLKAADGFDLQLAEKSLPFEKGDMFVFYTDGITEAMDMQGREFGESRLRQVVMEHARATASDVKDTVVASLTQFIGKAFLKDDATLVIVRIA
jgi:serine phosphatase RsbU (regulator of sigma subunit)